MKYIYVLMLHLQSKILFNAKVTDFFSRGQREEAQNFNKVSDQLTVENDPSPRTFPNLKSSGFFFFTAGVVEDVGDWGLEDEEPEAAFCKQA